MTNLLMTYSNAVLVLLLPKIGEFAQKLDLPEQRCTVADVRTFNLLSEDSPDGVFVFRNGNIYRFTFGYVQSFESAHSFYHMQAPYLFEKFYGPLNMTRDEAVDLARKAIRKLGYTEEMLYADLEPEVGPLPSVGTNVIPHYLIEWPAPNFSITSAKFEINGSTRRIESVWLLNRNLERDPPVVPGFPTKKEKGRPKLPIDKGWPLMTNALPRIAAFAKALDLPPMVLLDTNSVSRFEYYDEDGCIIGKIKLHDGYTFTVKGNRVLGFESPDIFFGTGGEIRVRDFVGEWRIKEEQAIAIARKAVKKLGIDDRVVSEFPRIDKPFGQAKDLVPRCLLCWFPTQNGLQTVMVEVDGATGTIKSLMIGN